MIKQLAHICLGAKDLNACEDFYCRVLGFPKKFEFKKNGELFGFYFVSGANTYIEVFIQNEDANYERPIIKHLCFEVDDIDEFISTVRSRGWKVTDKKMGADHSWQCWIADPDGVQIEVQQYTENSTQFTGQDCIVDW